MNRWPRRFHAFTLIETLIAVALLMLLSAAMLAFLFDLRTQRLTLSDLSSDLEVGSVLFDRIERDLALCLAQDPERETAGVKGDASSLSIVARRVWLNIDDPALGMRALTRTTYRFDAASNTLTIEADNQTSILSDRVEAFRIRYNDTAQPDTWRESFDAVESAGLPVAIEVAIWFKPPGPARRDNTEPTASTNAVPTDPRLSAAAEEASAIRRQALASPMSDSSEVPDREPDRWRIFALPDAEPTAGRNATNREASF